MEHLTRITQMPGTMGGKACIRGMRVTVGITVDPNRTRLRVLPLMSKQNAQNRRSSVSSIKGAATSRPVRQPSSLVDASPGSR